MVERWPSAIVARTDLETFTGGLMSCKYMANLDCMGQGCERIQVGRKIGYPTRRYTEWLRARSRRFA